MPAGHETPSECAATESDCPVPTAHRRLAEAHTLWHECLSNYDDPTLFTTYLNSVIQTLRNVTFALQKELSHRAGFDEWYEPWQEAMKKQKTLKWMVRARNKVVKEGDLETASTVRGYLVFGYADAAALTQRRIADYTRTPVELQVDVFDSIETVRSRVDSLTLPEFMVEEGIVVLERRWEVDDFQGAELLNLLAYNFSFLATIVADADIEFAGVRDAKSPDVTSIDFGHSAYPRVLRPACMATTHELRTMCFRYIDNDTDVGGLASPIVPDVRVREAAVHKFGKPDPVEQPISALDYVDSMAKSAVSIVATGEDHGSFLFYFRGGSMVYGEMLFVRDKSDKYVMSQEIVHRAVTLGATGVTMIAEVWMGRVPAPGEEFVPAADQPGRTEALQVYSETSEAEVRSVLIPFSRTAAGVTFGDWQYDDTPMNFFLPLRAAWEELALPKS